MPFKIVKTIEKGKPELCIVPSQWESAGILQWPRHSEKKLSKNENTIPGADWLKMDCVVKRRNIHSYETANAELQAMLENTDTEREDESTIRLPVHRPESVNFNVLAEQLESQEDCGLTTTTDCRNATDVQPGETFIIVSDNTGTQASTVNEQNSDLQSIILQNQSILFDITNQIKENQTKIIHKLASISVQIEECFSKAKGPDMHTASLKDASRAVADSFVLKHIENVQDLEEMEKLLGNNDYKNKLKNSCTFICSGGLGNGTNYAYRFVDMLFSRAFLCECSWSGSTRKDGVKVSLKCYKNTLRFFFEMINYWDTSYTLEDNEAFFKNILRNSTKRKCVKYETMPTKRQRSKGVNFAKKHKTNDASNKIEGSGTEAINMSNNEVLENIQRLYNNDLEEEESLC